MIKVNKELKIAGNMVNLRGLEEKNIEMLRGWRNENRKFFFNSEIITKDQQKNWFAGYEQKRDDYVFIIEAPKEVPVGSVSLYHIDLSKKTAEYGRIMIAKKHKRKGYGEDATKVLISYGFSKMGLNEIYLEVIKSNDRAINLYKKLGFTITEEYTENGIEILKMAIKRT